MQRGAERSLPTTAVYNQKDRRKSVRFFTEVGGQSTAGKVFKSQKGWYNKGIGTDAYGFSALPAGDWFFLRKFDSCVLSTHFWSATQDDGDCDDCAYNMHLSYDNENAGLFVSSPHFGYSVRCLKNEP